MAPTNSSYVASIDEVTDANANNFVNTSIESTSFANFQNRMSSLSFLQRLEAGVDAAMESNRTDAMLEQIESDMKNLDMEGKEAQEQWRKKALEMKLSAPNTDRMDCPKVPKTEPKDDGYEITYLVSVRKRRIESAADIESKKRVLATVYENIAKAATERLQASLGKMGVPMTTILQLIEKNERAAKGGK